MNPPPAAPPLEIYLLGLVDFDDIQQVQRRLVYDLGEHDQGGGSLILCEHPPTISVGRSGSRSHILLDDAELRGQGVAVSLRDSSLPRQRYLARVLVLAETSGIPYQREVESSGGSDGAGIDQVSITDHVVISAEGLHVAGAQLPRGHHHLVMLIADQQGQIGSRDAVFDIL